jgi:AraC-like DNA-binding protein
MRILSLLPDSARRVLELAVGQGHSVSHESHVTVVVRLVRERQIDVLVFDPGTLAADEFTQLVPALRQKTVPLLLFTTLTPHSAGRIVTAAEHGAHELVLRDAEDPAPLIGHKLRSLVAPSAPAMLLNRVARRFRRFPEPLQTASLRLFGSGALPRWVDDLARSSGFARRTVDRWMQRAGIDGASTLLDAARLARVWEPVVDGRMSTGEAAKQCGYSRTRLLVAHARRIVGVPPAEFREELTREKFAERLARRLLIP